MIRPLTIAGVCSGIGGFDLGFALAGYDVLWSCEKDPQARAVLEARFPHVTHYTDLLNDELFDAPAPDVLTGGTPCQGFSLAGQRRGLADDRSNLCLRFVQLAARFPGSTVLWENVPGVLSMPDNAFGTFLAGLVGADTALLPSPCPDDGKPNRHWRRAKGSTQLTPKWPSAGVVSGPLRTAAWRVLDAQYFGVAQRRNRVFVVADPGDGSAPAVLFEPESVRRDTPPRREAGQGFTHDVAPSLVSGGRAGVGSGESRGQDPVVAVPFETGPAGSGFTELAPTMNCSAKNGPVQNQIGLGIVESVAFGGNNTAGPIATAAALTCNRGNHSGDFEVGTLIVPPVSGTLMAGGKTAGSATSQDAENGMLIPEVLAFAQRERGDDGRGYTRPPATSLNVTGTLDTVKPWHIVFDTTQITSRLNYSYPKPGDPCHPLASTAHAPAIAFPEYMGSTAHASTENLAPALGAVNPTAVAFQERGRGNGATNVELQEELAYALTAPNGGSRSQEKNIAVAVGSFQQNSMEGKGSLGFEESTTVLRPVKPQPDHQMLVTPYAVRRLTPRECDRLQGFPDDWGLVPFKSKPMSDAARYRQLGNAVNVAVIHWLAQRLALYLRPSPITTTPKS